MSHKGRLTRNRTILCVLTFAFFSRGLFLILALPIGDPLDELFHSAYAEYFAATGSAPRAATLSIPSSSSRVTAMMPRSTNFGGPKLTFWQFLAQPDARQRELRKIAFTPVPAERGVFAAPNYESQQPPLMYAIAASVLDVSSSRIDLRLFDLRLIAILFASCAVPLSYLFFRRILSQRSALGATLALVAFPGIGVFTSRFTMMR